ncbi:unnamed protein product (macronuclear) [Paramecium tetraurelia]|uniref:Uncharacterized protein n=1 Tax=Paramecium tetraurelia TaxID=5888 RepID=A0BZC9_PARTE|nr:uncharacterized protein GSPATT00033749001 [Paramecium tetraurelia]CAK63896.1 unnamed protein product [Paramecium tetraurelia]|eukprot:XP_001431294.1 hypothetical protein (macronuclear) [Paramecium tetraurelia strain d4-2]
MQKLKEQCQEALQFSSDLQQQLIQMKKDLLEKTQQIVKLQTSISMIDCEASDIQDLFWNVQKQTLLIKQTVREAEQNPDNQQIIQKQFEELQEKIINLEELVFNYLFNNKMNLKKNNKKKSVQNKENNEDNFNQKELQNKKKKYVSTIKKTQNPFNSNFINEESDEDDKKQQKKCRKRLRSSIADQSNNLINDMFNFN